ncbi:MAG: hypothetical protein U9R48_00040 [Chloroflexota bacterium]|nr:hypothetical protein [Chloroflexota bacterium]
MSSAHRPSPRLNCWPSSSPPGSKGSRRPQSLRRCWSGSAPSPRFDPSKEAHRQLAALGRACTGRVRGWIEGGGPGNVHSIGRRRSMVRELLAEELQEIDALVKPLL